MQGESNRGTLFHGLSPLHGYGLCRRRKILNRHGVVFCTTLKSRGGPAATISGTAPETRAGIEPAYRPLQGSCLTIRATGSNSEAPRLNRRGVLLFSLCEDDERGMRNRIVAPPIVALSADSRDSVKTLAS